MSQSLTVSDTLYERLQSAASARGFHTIEELLEHWQATDEEMRRRAEAVRRTDALYEELSARYGEMTDSTDLIREDRER
jgi:hypothetical protein